MSPSDFDYDWLVVGSGFGGSVSALRLAEKGHRVAVLEKGRRYAGADLPESTSDRRSFLWAPALGWRGIIRLRLFKDLFTPTQTVDDDTTIEFLTYGRNADALGRLFVRPIEAIVPGAQGRVLAVLAETTAELNLRTIAQLAGISQAQASRLMPDLVALGVVERREVPVAPGRCPPCKSVPTPPRPRSSPKPRPAISTPAATSPPRASPSTPPVSTGVEPGLVLGGAQVG